VNYYTLLTKETGVVVGASNDKTGNIKYGGDWIMESTSQDIELVYFGKSIKYYSYLLVEDKVGNGVMYYNIGEKKIVLKYISDASGTYKFDYVTIPLSGEEGDIYLYGNTEIYNYIRTLADEGEETIGSDTYGLKSCGEGERYVIYRKDSEFIALKMSALLEETNLTTDCSIISWPETPVLIPYPIEISCESVWPDDKDGGGIEWIYFTADGFFIDKRILNMDTCSKYEDDEWTDTTPPTVQEFIMSDTALLKAKLPQ